MHLDLIFSNPQKSNTKVEICDINIIQIQQIQDFHGFMICVHKL